MKMRALVLAAALAVMVAPQQLAAEDSAVEWFDKVAQASSGRLDGVDHFVKRLQGVMMQSMFEMQGGGVKCYTNCITFLAVQYALANGGTMSADYLLSPMELGLYIGTAASPEQLAAFGAGMSGAQDQLDKHEDEMTGPGADIARSIFGDIGMTSKEVEADINAKTDEDTKEYNPDDDSEKPWLNPFRLMGASGMMYTEAANEAGAARAKLDNREAQVRQEAEQMRAMAKDGTVAGAEKFDGRPAVRINFPAAKQTPETSNDDDSTFVPTSSSVLIDKDKLVILQYRVEGLAAVDGEMREAFIETVYSDFRDVPGSKMYEPYKTTMRMGGMLDDEQMAEMEEARKQLAEFDKQLAAMSPSERKMVEGMMGSQMDMVRNMAAGGGMFEHTEIVDEILVNPDLAALYDTGFGSPKSVLQQIQEHLVALDYSPGNTDGVLDTLTTVAISQFQAERGLAVTGEPSTTLLEQLAAEASN